MPRNKIARGIERVVRISAKGLGDLQIGVDKILWGNPSPPKDKKSSAQYQNKPAKEPVSYTTGEIPIARTQTATREQLTAGASPAADVLAGRISAAPTTTVGSLASRISATPTAVNVPEKSLVYRRVVTKPEKPKPGEKLITSGLFNALDALNSVDLCNVIAYAYDSINVKKQPRPERSIWTPTQVAFFTLQDQAGLAITAIDKYTAYPNVFIGSYLGVGSNAVPPQQAATQSNAPTQGGTAVQKYNMYYLLKSIGEIFSSNTNTTGSLFTSQDAVLLREVPGLGSNLNFVNDFLGNVNKYSDFNQISTPELLALQNKIGKLRAVSTTIQNLNFRNAINLTSNFIGIDIRSQVQRLNEFVDITRIADELKNINDGIRSFRKIATRVQAIITAGQNIIKLAILFIKIFKFIVYFFGILPLPIIFNTAGAQTKIQDAKDAARDESDGVVRVLKSINALLGVATNFIRYLVVNANELLIRLDSLLLNLEACDAFKNSDVLSELQQTRDDLNILLDELSSYVISYDSKTDPDRTLFGTYEIRILEEEVVDVSIENKRRRGVALDQNGTIIVQSDLTFATDPNVIIGEVKQKLVALGLVGPNLGTIDGDVLSAVSEALNYLDNNDILDDDLNIDATPTDLPDNLNENSGLGLNAFINNLKGGRALRRRTRAALAKNYRESAAELQRTDNTGRFTTLGANQIQQAVRLEVANLRDQIKEWQAQIAIAVTQGPIGIPIIADRREKIVAANRRILELQRGG